MSTLPPPRRPWAVTLLAAGLVFLFLALLGPLGALALKFREPLLSGALGESLQNHPVILAHALALLLLVPLSAGLILRRRPLGHRLALAFLGYLAVQFAGRLLFVYGLSKYSSNRGVIIWGTLLLFNGLLFYLALRPEVFAYTRPDPNST